MTDGMPAALQSNLPVKLPARRCTMRGAGGGLQKLAENFIQLISTASLTLAKVFSVDSAPNAFAWVKRSQDPRNRHIGPEQSAGDIVSLTTWLLAVCGGPGPRSPTRKLNGHKSFPLWQHDIIT